MKMNEINPNQTFLPRPYVTGGCSHFPQPSRPVRKASMIGNMRGRAFSQNGKSQNRKEQEKKQERVRTESVLTD